MSGPFYPRLAAYSVHVPLSGVREFFEADQLYVARKPFKLSRRWKYYAPGYFIVARIYGNSSTWTGTAVLIRITGMGEK